MIDCEDKKYNSGSHFWFRLKWSDPDWLRTIAIFFRIFSLDLKIIRKIKFQNSHYLTCDTNLFFRDFFGFTLGAPPTWWGKSTASAHFSNLIPVKTKWKVTQPSPCPLHSSKQQDNDALLLAASAPCPQAKSRNKFRQTHLWCRFKLVSRLYSWVRFSSWCIFDSATETQRNINWHHSWLVFLEEKSSEWGVNCYKNTAIWLAWKISIFWWKFPSDSKLTTTNIYKW